MDKKDKNNQQLNKDYKKITILVVAFVTLILVMYVGARRYDNLVYPDISLYDEYLGKSDQQTLDNKVNNIVNNINNKNLIIQLDNKSYQIKMGNLIESINSEQVKNEIMSYGKDRTFLEQFGLIYLNVNRNYKFDIKVNNDIIQKEIDKIDKDTAVKSKEPTLKINNEKVELVKGENGKVVDRKDLLNKIISSVNNVDTKGQNTIVKTNMIVDTPKIKEKDLLNVNYKISEATTYFGGTGYNRGLNIANAASKVNGTLLMPGDKFSYEEKVSPVELYNGYYMAPVIVNGEHKNAPGGGVCQVCTTIYNAELKAGILPTVRFNHSKPVSYVRRGLDATLATDSKNLIFQNKYNYPIYIHAYTVGGQITVEFWSNKSVLEGKEYIPVSFIQGNIANTYLYGYNSNKKLIYKKFVNTSIYK